MTAADACMAICAMVFIALTATGLHTLQMWLERCDIDMGDDK